MHQNISTEYENQNNIDDSNLSNIIQEAQNYDGLQTSVHSDNKSESDTASELTPPKNKKRNRNVFDDIWNHFSNMQPKEKTISKEKLKFSTAHCTNSVKVHPCEFEIIKPPPKVNDARYQYLIECLFTVANLFNTRDVIALESIIDDICTENCLFKSYALTKPVTGRHHIMEMFKSVFRTSHDMNLQIYSIDEKEVDGSLIMSSNYIITGKF